jgi:nucleoside triphosphate diphosphatase
MADAPQRPPRIAAPPPGDGTPGAEFARLVEIMRLLRSPDGCPWDREQSWATLAPYVLEEAYEVVDAIERDDAPDLCEEIGDHVFEGVFLAQVAAEAGRFTIADALRSMSEKLIRRHPHVFIESSGTTPGSASVTTPRAVIEQWDAIKAREREAASGAAPSALDGLPAALPSLARADALGSRAARTGFDWPDAASVLVQVEEELEELRETTAAGPEERIAEELGDLLFALAQFARKTGLDSEGVLRRANTKFSTRFRTLEQEVRGRGRSMSELSLDDLEAIWQQVKAAGG